MILCDAKQDETHRACSELGPVSQCIGKALLLLLLLLLLMLLLLLLPPPPLISLSPLRISSRVARVLHT